MSNKPTILGFKPSLQDWEKVQALNEYFSSQLKIGTVSNSDILKMAIDELHKKYILFSSEK